MGEQTVNGVQQGVRIGPLHRAWRAQVALVLLSAWFSTGCTLIGLGVGSAAPRRPVFRGPMFDAPRGATVTAYLVSPPRYPDRLCGMVRRPAETFPRPVCETPVTTHAISGKFRGSDVRYVWIERDGLLLGIETVDVDHLTRESSYWATGTLVGAALDVIAVSAIMISIGNGLIAAGAVPH